MLDVTLPQLGESITEGTVTRLLKQVGDTVRVDEPLFEVSTDKVDTEVPSPVAGVIAEILVKEGDTVEVGTVVYRLSDGAAAFTTPAPLDPPAALAPAASASEPAPAPAATPAQAATDVVNVELPQLGESVTEGTVTRLLKQVGDTVRVDEPLFEVSTDKVDTEVPSPVAGVIAEILVKEGDTVAAGSVVLRVTTSSTTSPSPAPEPTPIPAPTPAPQPTPTPTPAPTPAPAPAPATKPAPAPAPPPPSTPAPAPSAATPKTVAPVLSGATSRVIPPGPGFQTVAPSENSAVGYIVCSTDVPSQTLGAGHIETLSRAAFALARVLEKMRFAADSFSFEIPVPPQHTLHVQLPRVTDLRLGALTTAVAALKERVENKAVSPKDLAPASVLVRFDEYASHSSLCSESLVVTVCSPREEVVSLNGSFAIRAVCELTITAPSGHALSGAASQVLRAVALELESRAWDREG